MKIHTLAEVISAPNGGVISGLVGKISYIFPAKDETNKFSGLPQRRQSIVLKDGKDEVVVKIDEPNPEFTGEDVGKKVYVLSTETPKGLVGVKRGTSTPSTRDPKKMVNYVYASAKSEITFAEPGAKPAATESTEDDIPFLSPPPKTEPTPEPVGSFEESTPVNTGTPVLPASADSYALLHNLAVRYEACVEEALAIAIKTQEKIGVATGSQWSDQAIQAMASTLFIEGHRKAIW